jgi:hypothetical protein
VTARDDFEVQWEDHARRFETMDRDELLREARKWCWNTLIARNERERIFAGTAGMLTSHERRLSRLWALQGPGKTIQMDAFRKAFGVGVSDDQENDYR